MLTLWKFTTFAGIVSDKTFYSATRCSSLLIYFACTSFFRFKTNIKWMVRKRGRISGDKLNSIPSRRQLEAPFYRTTWWRRGKYLLAKINSEMDTWLMLFRSICHHHWLTPCELIDYRFREPFAVCLFGFRSSYGRWGHSTARHSRHIHLCSTKYRKLYYSMYVECLFYCCWWNCSCHHR